MINNIKVSGIFIYPVKSLGGISLNTSIVEKRGFKYDRRWMLVDSGNNFISQRTVNRMALIQVSIKVGNIIVKRNDNKTGSYQLPLAVNKNDVQQVTVMNDTVTACHFSKEADEWFSSSLNTECRLVYMPESSSRVIDPKYAADDEIVSFADGYPFLIIGEASLEDLNSRLDKQIPMNRFRPNIVFAGGEPYEENTWKKFNIGNLTFRGVKPCSRCVITTVDQQTGVKEKEPLKTLSRYRKFGNKIFFGENAIHNKEGIIKKGDKVDVWMRKKPHV